MKHLKSNFEKLKVGCLMRSIQKANSEPEKIAIDQISKELRYLQRQSEYTNEIERVLNELRLTTQFIAETKGNKLSEIIGISKQELLAYYQGIFLTLVHQMKDKVTQLIHLMTEETLPEKPAMEKKIKVVNLLRKKQDIFKEMGIEDEIKQWDEENRSSKIAVALRKRTHHHHKVSGLRYDNDFLKLGFTDIGTQSPFQEMLTDYGKQQIEKMRTESTERLFCNAETKAKDTLAAIEVNIEKISLALVNYFKLPISEEEVARIVNEQGKMLGSFDISNSSSFEKIPEFHKELLKGFIRKVNGKYKDAIEAIYLVGSLGRGEYEEGYSDVNIYIIFSEDKPLKNTVEEIVNLIPYGEELSVKVFSKSSFFSEKCQKYRVIVKADGTLIYGTDLIKAEEMPKAGLLAALILNGDILDELDEAKKWMEENPAAAALEISKKSKKLAKRFIDFIYGVVMCNKPQYTSSRAERVVKINEMWPENKNMLEKLLGVSKYGVGKLESFNNLIEVFRPKAEKNLNKMLDIKRQIEEQQKS